MKRWIIAKFFGNPDQALPLLRRLFVENVRQHTLGYVAAFACMALVAATTGASAWIMKDIINRIFIEKNEAMVWLIAGGIAIIYTVKGLSSYGQEIILTRIGNNIIASLQKRIFDHLLRQSIDFYHRFGVGDLATRMSYNAQAARTVIDLVVTSLGRDLLSVIALTAVMVAQDPLMSALVLVIMPCAVLGVSSITKRTKTVMAAELQSLAKIVTTVSETATGIRLVKAFNLENRMRRIMASAVRDVEKRANKIAMSTALTGPLMESLGGFAVALVVLYGGWNVIERGANAGAFFSFITALLMAYEPAKRLARLNVQFHSNMVIVAGLYDLLDQSVTTAELPDAVDLKIREGNVRLDQVAFAYGKSRALSGFTLDVKPRSVTALVGPSGGGKTTVFALIERFYDPQEGTITIDGQDLRDVTFESLRSNVALVTQEPFLFNGSVRENISYGKPNASEEEIFEAARNANAHEFIIELPNGYETPVGDGGNRLSGGQRQRITIARAMLRNTPILLLDEPTSALDAQSESNVQEALDRLMRDRTTIVIAHRLSTVRNANMIYVMEHGKVLQSGSHRDLIAEGGLYSQLYALQFREPIATPLLVMNAD
ncbi:MAG: ABC transporter ATP-binding protein [Pseudomonadota bacterium]